MVGITTAETGRRFCVVDSEGLCLKLKYSITASASQVVERCGGRCLISSRTRGGRLHVRSSRAQALVVSTSFEHVAKAIGCIKGKARDFCTCMINTSKGRCSVARDVCSGARDTVRIVRGNGGVSFVPERKGGGLFTARIGVSIWLERELSKVW